jgi:hypothetical protein
MKPFKILLVERGPSGTPRSLDDLPDVRHTFEYCADLAAILLPEPDLEKTQPMELLP